MIKREPTIIKKYENPYFWLGIIGVVFGSAGIEIETLTSWKLMADAIWSILNNPIAIMAVIAAVNGVIVNHNTPGRKD